VRKFLKNNFLILILVNLANVFNYLFQMVVARKLTAADYGGFNALNSMAVILSAPVAVIPMVLSRYTVKLSMEGMGKIRSLLEKGLRVALFIAVSGITLGLLALPWLKDFVHLDSSIPVIIMLVQLGLAFIFPLLLGVVQGLHRFKAFGLGVSSVTFIRFLGGVIFVVVLGLGINGALLAGILGSCTAFGVGLWAVRDVFKVPKQPLPENLLKNMLRFSMPVFISSAMVMILGNLDIVLVRHFCTEEESGLYATAAILGRVALFLPGALITVLFPEAAKAQDSGNNDSRMLWISLGLTGLLGCGFSLICFIWSSPILVLLFGSKYEAAAPLLQAISLAMALLAMANVFFTDGLARSNYTFLWPLVAGVVLMLVLISMFHGSALTIARILLLSTIFVFIGTTGNYLARFRSPATTQV